MTFPILVYSWYFNMKTMNVHGAFSKSLFTLQAYELFTESNLLALWFEEYI
ncbi:hypothetical protein Pint_21640 [Pistacia integerrima]|uniref:Uncharacterized protein n=1 Tax=Pistacia integerrima TaxID=434235 RepID=A0ACC0XEH2_9ROSI|nr:hypothetical protein Pint_21640 [Pistacia integerrima]